MTAISDKNTKISSLNIESIDFKNLNYKKHEFFRCEDTLIVRNISPKDTYNILKEGEIYRTTEYRILKIKKGEVNISLNLNNITLHQGDIIFVSKGVLIQINNIDKDVKGEGILFNEDRIADNIIEKSPVFVISPKDENKKYNDDLFELLWQTTQLENFPTTTFLLLLKAYISNVFFLINKEYTQQENIKLSRSEDIFKRFLALVNQYKGKERAVNFYADKLFISEKYLSAVIKKESGLTVMQWINKQTILEAKILLKHSDKTVYQVSDELDFPNASFFTKFFKRLTGITPKEFQKQ